jgi:hypothetical protein
MGWDIDLVSDNGLVQVPNHNEGSIQSFGTNGSEGTQDATMAVTYNYSGLYRLVIDDGLKDYLRNKIAKDTINTLKLLVDKLGTDQYKRKKDGYDTFDFKNGYEIDYWCPTMGNAGHIAAILLDWAQLHPEGKWEISSE